VEPNRRNFNYLKTKKRKTRASFRRVSVITSGRGKLAKIQEGKVLWLKLSNGNLIAKGKKFGIVVSRFNEFITKGAAFRLHGYSYQARRAGK